MLNIMKLHVLVRVDNFLLRNNLAGQLMRAIQLKGMMKT